MPLAFKFKLTHWYRDNDKLGDGTERPAAVRRQLGDDTRGVVVLQLVLFDHLQLRLGDSEALRDMNIEHWPRSGREGV